MDTRRTGAGVAEPAVRKCGTKRRYMKPFWGSSSGGWCKGGCPLGKRGIKEAMGTTVPIKAATTETPERARDRRHIGYAFAKSIPNNY